MKCCICEETFEDEHGGNSVRPLNRDGKCCNKCNEEVIIPLRLLENIARKEQGDE